LPLALDAKLRRLCSSAAKRPRLAAEIARGSLVAAGGEAATADAVRAAEHLSRRVLVLLTRDQPPAAFADLDWSRVVDRMFTVTVPLSRLAELARQPEVRFVEAGRRLVPALDSSVAETRADLVHAAPPGLRGAGVIVGVIDVGGLDFTLDDFRNPNGTTRVAFLWDQNLSPAGPGERSPDGYTYGVEYTAADLDAALQAANPFARVRHEADPGSHATHVASTAAGNGRSGDADFPAGRFVDTAPDATIIFVEAGTERAAGTFTDSVRVADAVAYVFRKAQELRMPCVINMSLGQNGGSHDGDSVVERAIDRLSEVPGRAFVLAGGKQHVFRGHASGLLSAAGQTRTLRWQFGGGLPLGVGGAPLPTGRDRTPREMEIWYSSQDQIRVTVTAPGGQTIGPLDPGETVDEVVSGGVRVFVDSIRFSPLNGDAQIYIDVSPTTNAGIPAGTWQVSLEAVESQVGRFDAWIERDARDRNTGFADQTFFLGTDFDPVGTLGTPATGRRSIVVANYDHRAEVPSGSSGRGPTRDGRQKPEVAAPGTGIVAACAMGGRPSGNGDDFPLRIPMSGTSMAAPHVAGIVALLFQRNPRLSAEQVRKILIASARPVQGAGNFDPAWGFGRVDARAAVELVPQ
jgi:subtilisin family serine protease